MMSGYVTFEEKELDEEGSDYCKICIPNKEVMIAYKKEIVNRYCDKVSGIATEKIQQALRLRDACMLQEAMEEFLLCTISYYDTTNESFYHGLVLGVVAMFSIYYEISSNREAGKGRYDIMLRPRDKERPAYIIELKALKKTNMKDDVEESLLDSELEGLAFDALNQIKDKEYYANLCEDNCFEIVLVGMAFYKKKCCIKIEK